jgi:hypothetical protein
LGQPNTLGERELLDVCEAPLDISRQSERSERARAKCSRARARNMKIRYLVAL